MDTREFRQRLIIAISGGLTANQSQVEYISRMAALTNKDGNQMMANTIIDLASKILASELDNG